MWVVLGFLKVILSLNYFCNNGISLPVVNSKKKIGEEYLSPPILSTN